MSGDQASGQPRADERPARPIDPAARWKAIAVLAICGLLAAGLMLERTVFKSTGTTSRPAPDATWTDRQGKSVSLSQFRGRYVLINFWATWCPPCVEEVPSLERLAEALAVSRPDIAILAPSVDEQGWEVVDPFLRKMKVDAFTVLLDSGKSASKFGTRKLPETWLIGPDGEIIDPAGAPSAGTRGSRFMGPQTWDHPELVAWFEDLGKKNERAAADR